MIDLPTLKALAESAKQHKRGSIAAFARAASPATVLSLIARVEKAEDHEKILGEELTKICSYCQKYLVGDDPTPQFESTYEGVRRSVKKAESELATAREKAMEEAASHIDTIVAERQTYSNGEIATCGMVLRDAASEVRALAGRK